MHEFFKIMGKQMVRQTRMLMSGRTTGEDKANDFKGNCEERKEDDFEEDALVMMQQSVNVEPTTTRAASTPTHEELFEKMELIEMRLEDPEGFRQVQDTPEQHLKRRRIIECLERSAMQLEDEAQPSSSNSSAQTSL